MIKKRDALKLLDDAGTQEAAARVLGVTAKSISNWPTTDDGYLTNPKHYDLIAAALWRKKFIALVEGKIRIEDEDVPVEMLMNLATPPQG